MRSFLTLILTLLLVLPPASPLAAQVIPAAPAKLNIIVLEGENAVNYLGQRAGGPAVRVEDETRSPVKGAAVLFTLPDSGPSGTFARRALTYLVQTDGGGRAEAKGFRANDIQGKFQIQVRASFHGTTATSSIAQVNAVMPAGAKKRSHKLVVILAGVGAAVAAGAVVAARSGGASSTPISITPGTGTVGGR